MITQKAVKPAELLRSLDNAGAQMYIDSYKKGRSLSAYMEELSPSTNDDQLDAFERCMVEAEIRTTTMPEFGIYADRFEEFDKSVGTRALAMEWVARRWREAATGQSPSVRALYLSGDYTAGTIMRPYVDAARVRMKQLTPAIPLSRIVAIKTMIDQDTYRAFYLTDDTDETRMKRVAEGAEVPRAILKGGEHAIRLKKYGRALEMTYEQLRRQQIDMVALHIARMAIQAESDKVADALAVLISGDGNANTAATVHALTTLDPAASAGTLTMKGYLAFKLKFTNPYVLTTFLAQEAGVLQALLLTTGNSNVLLSQIQGPLNLGGLQPINPELGRTVSYGVTAGAPALKLVGFDDRLALEHISETGANVTEVEKFISRQTQALVMTETEGFAVYDQFATQILNINA